MKAVSGFQADDGTFFETAEAAEQYEAERLLNKALNAAGVDPRAYKAALLKTINETRRFLNAYESQATNEPQPSRINDVTERSLEDDIHSAIDASSDEDFETQLELQAGGLERLSEVRGSGLAEEIPDDSQSDGPRVWRDDASGVRRRKDMAVMEDARDERARRGNRHQNIRRGPMARLRNVDEE